MRSSGAPPSVESKVVTDTSREPFGSVDVASSIWKASKPPWLNPTREKSVFAFAEAIARSMERIRPTSVRYDVAESAHVDAFGSHECVAGVTAPPA